MGSSTNTTEQKPFSPNTHILTARIINCLYTAGIAADTFTYLTSFFDRLMLSAVQKSGHVRDMYIKVFINSPASVLVVEKCTELLGETYQAYIYAKRIRAWSVMYAMFNKTAPTSMPAKCVEKNVYAFLLLKLLINIWHTMNLNCYKKKQHLLGASDH